MKKNAIVLLSGGLDSSITLYLAKDMGYEPFALVFDYGQQHKKEIASAKKIAQVSGCKYRVVKIEMPEESSSLLSKSALVPTNRDLNSFDIPDTYVPARNILFLSFALSWAESMKAEAAFIGANAIDYSGYPDCRPDFYKAYQRMVEVGTKAGIEGRGVKILAPLLHKSKGEIIKLGLELGVPLSLTWS